jgi:hypothetical protein
LAQDLDNTVDVLAVGDVLAGRHAWR